MPEIWLRNSRAVLEVACAGLNRMPLDALSVYECAVLATQIDKEKILPLLHDLGMVARNAGVRDDQVLVNFAAHAERDAVQDDVFLFTTLHEHEGGKHSGAGAVMTDAV
jgi:hypothetical protein